MPLWRELSADLATKKQQLPAEYAKATPRPIHENDPKIAIPRKPYVNLAAGNGSSHRWFFRTGPVFLLGSSDLCNFVKSLAAGEDIIKGMSFEGNAQRSSEKGIPNTTFLKACHWQRNVRPWHGTKSQPSTKTLWPISWKEWMVYIYILCTVYSFSKWRTNRGGKKHVGSPAKIKCKSVLLRWFSHLYKCLISQKGAS